MANDVLTHEMVVLHVVRVNGFASPAAVAEMTGAELCAAEKALAALAERGLLVFRDRLAAYGITGEGRASHAAWVEEELAISGHRDVVEAAYEGFVALNEPFKAVCTDFQLAVAQSGDRDAAGRTAVEGLEPIHDAVGEVVAALTGALARFDGYRSRFNKAFARLRAAEWDALAKPLAGSYHDAWMSLHEDLLCTLGRRRGDHDGA